MKYLIKIFFGIMALIIGIICELEAFYKIISNKSLNPIDKIMHPVIIGGILIMFGIKWVKESKK
jgi:uncharacterized membrane protein